MKCPNCVDGKLFGFGCPCFKPIALTCNICEGTGILPEDINYDPEAGRVLKDERLSRDSSLREEAKIKQISPSELSGMERGYFRKKMPKSPIPTSA